MRADAVDEEDPCTELEAFPTSELLGEEVDAGDIGPPEDQVPVLESNFLPFAFWSRSWALASAALCFPRTDSE